MKTLARMLVAVFICLGALMVARGQLSITVSPAKVVGQATRWMIGGEDKAGLVVGATNAFHFVVTGQKPFSATNLTAKVTVPRLVLAGGKPADPRKDVTIK